MYLISILGDLLANLNNLLCVVRDHAYHEKFITFEMIRLLLCTYKTLYCVGKYMHWSWQSYDLTKMDAKYMFVRSCLHNIKGYTTINYKTVIFIVFKIS